MLGWFDGCAIGKRTDFHQNARIGQFWSKRTKNLKSEQTQTLKKKQDFEAPGI